MMDLAVLIDEANLSVRGVGLNPRLDEALALRANGYGERSMAVLQAGRDQIGRWMVESATEVRLPVAMFGRPAAVLYQALAGHSYGRKPAHYAEVHLCQIAVQARASIASMRGGAESWVLAWRVVEAAGPTIQPWLCVLALDVDGRPLEASPLYDVRIRL
jgi:hypothetical protein